MFVVKKLLLRKTGGLITNFRVIRPWSYEADFTVCVMYACVSMLFNKFNCKVFIFVSTYAFILFWNRCVKLELKFFFIFLRLVPLKTIILFE